MNLEAIWAELERDTALQHGYVLRRVAPAGVHDVYVGVRQPGGARLFLLRVDAADAPDNVEELGSAGMSVHVAPDLQDTTRCTIEMHLSSRDYADVFDSFIADVLGHVTNTPSEAEAAAVLLARLRRWQKFLMLVPATGLSPQAQLGLYGELWFLRHELIPIIGARLGVGAWTGPNRTNQDFQFRGFAAEVKVTTAKQPQSLRIASERQLDSTGVGTLILVHLSLDARRGSGESLPEAVADARALAKSVHELNELEETLFTAGYLDKHAHQYAHTGYEVRSYACYEVAAGFPRIIEAELRPGVGDVHYSLSVSQCLPYLITAGMLRSALERRLDV